MRATERTERTRVEAPEDLVVPEEEELEEEEEEEEGVEEGLEVGLEVGKPVEVVMRCPEVAGPTVGLTEEEEDEVES